MHIENGDLYKIQDELALKELKERFGELIQPVPKEHEQEALSILGDKEYTNIAMTKNTPLVNWAKKKRKRKMAKKSSKANRK